MNITSWQYVNDVTQMSIKKESYWLMLTLLHLEARSRSHNISIMRAVIKGLHYILLDKATQLVNELLFLAFLFFHMCASTPNSKRVGRTGGGGGRERGRGREGTHTQNPFY